MKLMLRVSGLDIDHLGALFRKSLEPLFSLGYN